MNAKEIVHRAGEKEPLENNTKPIPPFIMRKVVLGFTKKHNRPPTPKELEALESSVVRNYFCKTKHNFVTGEDEGIEVSRYGLDENGKTVKFTDAQMKELAEIASIPTSEEDEKIPPFAMRKIILGLTNCKPPTPKELEIISNPNLILYETKDEKPTIDRYSVENGKTVKLTPEELKALVDIASMPMSEEDKKKINDFMENHKTVIY